MEDREIVALYWQRQEQAIAESRQKYGRFCHRIARNILSIPEDAEECVSDTWMKAWDTMPPQRPDSLRAYLGCLVRNLSISRYRANRAQKRYDSMEILLSELGESSQPQKAWNRRWMRRNCRAPSRIGSGCWRCGSGSGLSGVTGMENRSNPWHWNTG